MGFLRRLLSRFNPTRDWEENPARPLVVDLDEHRFCSVAVGDAVEGLAFLGPGEVTPSGFAWPRKGPEVRVEAGRIEELGFRFGPPGKGREAEFAGEFRYHGAPVRLSGSSTETDVRSLFGEPYWRDQDEDEIILFYEFPDREWQFEFTLDGSLKYLTIGLPLLADAGQRTAYAVTKPWPPNFA